MKPVDAVVVAYHPNLSRFAQVLESLAPQVRSCHVVNNGPERWTFDQPNIHTTSLGANHGIAAAQNIGVAAALEKGAGFLLLCDQDTLFPPDYVARLLAVLDSTPRAAALTPRVYDEVRDEFRTVMKTRFRSVPAATGKPYPVKHAIASGMLVPAEAWNAVGPMRAELFIDFVDTEWCWRAADRGLTVYCCPEAVIRHRMGDKASRLMGRRVSLRADVRYYYMLRNAVYLTTGGSPLPLYQKVLFGARIGEMIVALLLLGFQNMNVWKMLFRALLDGFRRRLGQY